MKVNTWKTILQIAISFLTAIATSSELPAVAFKSKKVKKALTPSRPRPQRFHRWSPQVLKNSPRCITHRGLFLPFFFFTFNRDKTAKRGSKVVNSLIINLISISLQP